MRALRHLIQDVKSFLAAGAGLWEACRLAMRPVIAGASTWLTDLKNNILLADAAQTIVPQTATSTVTGNAIDMQAGEGQCFALLLIGAVSGTTPTLDVKFQESDTSGGTYADIAGATFAQQTAASHALAANFKRSKRFVRAVGTIAGTTPSFAFSVAVFAMKKAAG